MLRFAACLHLHVDPVYSQTVYGWISGVVKDPTGAVIQDVTVHRAGKRLHDPDPRLSPDNAGSYSRLLFKARGYTIRFQDGFGQSVTEESNDRLKSGTRHRRCSVAAQLRRS